jgi:quinolinate synthase
MTHVFDYKSKTSEPDREAAMTVLDCAGAVDNGLAAQITDGPGGYTGVIGDEEWAAEVRRLAALRGATILAHNYQLPAIQDVADHVGDSLALSRIAADAPEDTIVFCGVHFMAETAKILSPDKTVLIPDSRAGCSLASSVTGADIRALRRQYPGVPIVAYVNTSAEVKAEVDICCTSANALKVVESLGSDRVIMVPDRFLAANVARQTKVKIIAWHGACEVHERFTPEELLRYREDDPSIKLIAHPECPPEVVEVCDFSGSTAAMIDYVKTRQPSRVLLVTECSMADNVAAENPGVNFVRPCNLCPHMKRITLPKILDSLVYMREEVVVDPALAARARRSVERMIELK